MEKVKTERVFGIKTMGFGARLLMFAIILGISITMAACDSSDDDDSDEISDSEITTITYEVDPKKDTYVPGEDVTITAIIVGPDSNDIGVHWSITIKDNNISGFPRSSDDTYEFTTGEAGTSVNIIAEPNKSRSRNGVQLIRGDASFNFQIVAPVI